MSDETPLPEAPPAPPEGGPAPAPASDPAPVPVTPPEPATRLERLGAFFIDAAAFLLCALPAFRGAHDRALGLTEPVPGQIGAQAALVFGAFGAVLVLVQAVLAMGGRSLGARLGGLARVRVGDGAAPGPLRGVLLGALLPTLVLGGGLLAAFVEFLAPKLAAGPETLLGISKVVAPPPAWVSALEWAPRALVLAWVIGGLFALAGGRTLSDRLAGLVVVRSGGGSIRAFAPPRFSSSALGAVVLGLVASAVAAGGVFAGLAATGVGESTELDIPSLGAAVVLLLGIAAAGAAAALAARRFVVGELALFSTLTAAAAFVAMATRSVSVPSLQRFELASWLDYTVYAVSADFALVTFLVLGSAIGFMLSGDEGLDASTRFERLVARRHLRLKASHWVQLAFIATLAPVLVYAVFVWPVRAVIRLVRGEAPGKPLAPTVFMALLTIVGIMFGVMSLTVVLGVMRGFELDLKEKILGTNAHGVVHRIVGEFTQWREVSKKAATVAGVEGVTPFVLGEVMITTETDVTGAVLKGIDVETAGRVTDLEKNVEPGNGRLRDLMYPDRIPLSPLERMERMERGEAPKPEGTGDSVVPADPATAGEKAAEAARVTEEKAAADAETQGASGEVLPGLVVGKEMAESLRVGVGSRVTVMNPLGELGPNGPIPHARVFRVAAIFFSGMYEYDSKFAYIDLREAQRFYRMKDAVTGLELRFKNVDDARTLMKQVYTAIEGFPYRTKDWGEMNKNLFSALRLERVVMFILLSFQVLIACICVIATLVMLVVEKRKEVATLKSIGARESSIMKLFVLEGLMIGGIGTVYGETAGWVFCKLIEKYGVGLDPSVYYITRLPVVIEPGAFVSVGLLAMLLVFVATLYPARRGGSIAPVEGFREE